MASMQKQYYPAKNNSNETPFVGGSGGISRKVPCTIFFFNLQQLKIEKPLAILSVKLAPKYVRLLHGNMFTTYRSNIKGDFPSVSELLLDLSSFFRSDSTDTLPGIPVGGSGRL